jgi:hypothetical protein
MEPLNDEELNRILRQWDAPSAPSSLEARVLVAALKVGSWKWLLTGSFRIPVPVGVLAALLIVWVLFLGWRLTAPRPNQKVNFTNFQPVKELKPRIIRSVYDTN